MRHLFWVTYIYSCSFSVCLDLLDYHVEVSEFFYSVPHGLIRQQVDTRATERSVEIFHQGKRAVMHHRCRAQPWSGMTAGHRVATR